MVHSIIREKQNSIVRIDACGVATRDLNALLRESVADGAKKIELNSICGQR